MHRFRILCLALAACTLIAGGLSAQPKPAKEKSPGDIAAEEFFKLRDNKEAAPTPARFVEIINSGLSFLAKYPTHSKVSSVISSLATYGTTIRDKKLAALRASWLSRLQYEILRQGGSDALSEEAKTAFKAMGAAAAGAAARDNMSRETIDAYRDKIDRLAEMPDPSRFLAEQEKGYLDMLRMLKGDGAEKQAQKLRTHPDKKVAGMAQDELNLMAMRKQPLELKFTALDGHEVDVAQMRGKVLYFVFWSTTNEASTKDLAELKDFYVPYQKLGVEIITVSHDTDKDAVTKYVKDKHWAWPVLFDGQGNKGEFSAKLNARNPPASALFDQNGILATTGVRSSKLEAEVIKLGIKKK